ncbi:protein ACCELERATED CELL DEATH 6-like [Triticum dicoccoides]|uniref:protein ACCELERATED CELL DEATH 6-like n=1 Tax=Triticum dicoccoides TaxID=85692 RepID=UPI000E7BEC96|nr:protein ACCELERATED CELL DEATH 6-like [Triticum dicoccoides]
MSRSNDSSPGDMMSKTAPMNPLLLASVCFGSSAALEFLFRREDAQEPPMVMPTQEFLDLLVGYTLGNSARGRLTVLAPDDVELGIYQPASSGSLEDDIYQSASSGSLEGDIDQSALPAAARLLQGVTAEGDTALHAVASHGDSTEFQKCARIINERDQGLLFAVNRKGDTPLHCAARAGNSQVLSCLIELVESCDRLHELLRKENVLKETALHDAVRIGRKDIVESLMEADPELANYPKEGTSPLYLAILLRWGGIAGTLYDMSNGNLSYSGPNGQNALHTATLQGRGFTKLVLNWNNSLSTHGDRDGSTPLHLASSFWRHISFRQLFQANPAPAYQADNQGLFPIHIAASMGRKATIRYLLEKFPSSAGLRTAQGRTFLHVAIVKKRLNIVSFVCQTPSLDWILNMRDNDGNTALHLAVKVSSLRIFCCLFGNMEVQLDLANNNDESPVDLSRRYVPQGMHYNWDNEKWICRALKMFGDNHSGLRRDQYEEKYGRLLKPEDRVKEAEKMKDSSQILGIGSVLIATVTFGATFAVPGGFIADDHTNRGTPTLAGRYTFDAFMMANALAFICSSIATVALMFSGSPLVNLRTRKINLGTSYFFMSSSLTCLSAAFALGVYMVLAPVAHATAIAICVLSPLVVLYGNLESLLKLGIFARPLYLRMGPIRALKWLARVITMKLVRKLWPFVLIFGWAAIAQKLRNH